MNKEFKRMQQLAGIKEVGISTTGRNLSDQDIKDIQLAFFDFGASHSEFKLDKPISEERTKFDYGEGTIGGTDFLPNKSSDFPEYEAFLRLVNKAPGTYLGPYIWHGDQERTDGADKCPGAPARAFYTRLKVGISSHYETPNIILSTPDVGPDGYMTGWFDAAATYNPDTIHFDNDGNRIA